MNSSRLLRLVVVAILCIATPASTARSEGILVARDEQSGIQEATFRWVIKQRCQHILCLLSINLKPVAEELLEKFKPLGRISSASEADFIFEDAAARGFSRRGGRIIHLSRITVLSDSEATAEVDLISTGLGSSTCTYRLHRSSERWEVNAKQVQCTIT
jgi:hypothetical protein